MKTVKVSQAKNHLSQYPRYVRRGGRVRIYDRSTPVADLVPVEPVAGRGDEALLASLVQRGVVRPARERGPLPADFFGKGRDVSAARLAEAVREDREEREDAILQKLSDRRDEVDDLPLVRDEAARILRVHPLKAGDALQLAAAVVAFDYRPRRRAFLDEPLLAAARREGFSAVRPT
jgi:prevent-host-death family protein